MTRTLFDKVWDDHVVVPETADIREEILQYPVVFQRGLEFLKWIIRLCQWPLSIHREKPLELYQGPWIRFLKSVWL